MQLPLKRRAKKHYTPAGYSEIQWIKSAPFVVNSRAVLVHRIRSATSHLRNNNLSHHSFALWCANVFSGETCHVTHDIPINLLLCARCEAAAVKAGMPSADSLLGRHVHLGCERAVQVCCEESQNAN